MDLKYAEELSKENIDVLACFQCGTCSASCPMSHWDGTQVRKLVRKVNLGIKEEIYEDESFWQCTNCYACANHCPRELKPAQLTIRLRNEQTQKILNKIDFNQDSTKLFLCRELKRGYDLDLEDENVQTIEISCASNVTPELLLKCALKDISSIQILMCDSDYKCKHGDGRYVGFGQAKLTASMLEELGIEDLNVECKKIRGTEDAKSVIDKIEVVNLSKQ